ncbi:MAG: glycosyltransferase family 4 protein [Proteobacteria bacterium]|nr:glycosyltransferase family 4 protein [Pseudomonadota bacterium]
MNRIWLLLAPAALLTSGLLTYLMRRFALAHGILDLPNARSSHTTATPRGGGLAIVATTTLALLVLAVLGIVPLNLCMALLVGGVAVAAVGFLDDRRRLAPRWRLAVHTFAAMWAVAWVGGLDAVQVGQSVVHLGWVGKALAVLGVVWVVNLFNFMDGIDGLAAGEALFVACAGALLAAGAGSSGVAAAAWVFAWACAGFLVWNWPPARIFLGDVGSGYLGYVVIVLALAESTTRPTAIWEWFILGSLFFVDSTLTLLRRLFRGERVYEAHRQHAYQRLSRRWGSHLRVTCLVLGIGAAWLLPLSLLAARWPPFALNAVLAAALPVLLGCVLLGAGRRRD